MRIATDRHASDVLIFCSRGRGDARKIFPKLAIKRGSFAVTLVALAKSPSQPRANGAGDERRGERTLLPGCYTALGAVTPYSGLW